MAIFGDIRIIKINRISYAKTNIFQNKRNAEGPISFCI